MRIDFLGINYPHAPPLITFATRVYHSNIDGLGRIALDRLGEKWSSTLTIREGIYDSWLLAVKQRLNPKLIYENSVVLVRIALLMQFPLPHKPLVPEVAHIYLTDRPRYEETAREWTRKYAM